MFTEVRYTKMDAGKFVEENTRQTIIDPAYYEHLNTWGKLYQNAEINTKREEEIYWAKRGGNPYAKTIKTENEEEFERCC